MPEENSRSKKIFSQEGGHWLRKATLWLTGVCIVAGLGGMMGNSLAFSIGSFLFGLLLAVAYYLEFQYRSTKIVISWVASGLVLIILCSKPIAKFVKTPEIAKKLTVKTLNLPDWKPDVGETNLRGSPILEWLFPPTIRRKFIKDQDYPIPILLGHSSYGIGLNAEFTLFPPKDKVIQIRAPGWVTQVVVGGEPVKYFVEVSSIWKDYPRPLPVIHVVSEKKGRYPFTYEIQGLAIDANNNHSSIGLVKGKFVVDLY